VIFYALGVAPIESGCTVARVTPRLGGLQWAKGKVPTPHGLIAVHATAEQVTVDLPVPVVVDLEGQVPHGQVRLITGLKMREPEGRDPLAPRPGGERTPSACTRRTIHHTRSA
jgi:hypothetical protein